MAVVVVELPAKAKTINQYLGPGYTVLASYGHVRDLPAKDGSVDPDHDFEMKWEVAPDSQKHIRAIAEALKTTASSSSPPTPTARARRSPGTCSRRSPAARR